MVTTAIPATSNLAEMVSANSMPTTFNGDAWLFALNLWAMTAFALLGVMICGWMVASLYAHRKYDARWDPVTIYRVAWLCAGAALAIRCGSEAGNLWAWDSVAPITGAAVQRLKRILDPIGLTFAAGWLALVTLSMPSMVAQLRKKPYPVEMWSKLPSLKRPAGVVLMTAIAAAFMAWLK